MQKNNINYLQRRAALIMRTERYAKGVKNLYDSAIDEIAKLFIGVEYDSSIPFSFESQGVFGKVDAIMNSLERNIQQAVNMGVAKEFAAAYAGCEELIGQVFGQDVRAKAIQAFAPKLREKEAAQTFMRHTPKVSGNVWNGSTLAQMESAVHEALLDGMPAARMATHLKKFLNEPEEYFRRFRIKAGEDAEGNPLYGRKLKKRYQLPDGSFRWRDATPEDLKKETGVYRSSYKNALRYARTTTNIAYRTADYERYQDLPFIIGIEIKLSQTNHTQPDVCDDLAGRYPKDFLWTGWHPNCRCYQVPVIASKNEVEEMTDAILDGADPNAVEVDGYIDELPDNFTNYLEKNKERIEAAQERGTLPYFITDNMKGDDAETLLDNDWSDMENYRKYKRLADSRDYTNAEYNEELDCYKAISKDHSKRDAGKDQLFFGGLTSDMLEIECQNILYKLGHSCVLEAEQTRLADNHFVRSLDTITDGVRVDIRSICENGPNTIKNSIRNKSQQLGDYMRFYNANLDSVILYFHDASFFSEEKVLDALAWEHNQHIKTAICVINRGNGEVKVIKKPNH